MIKYIKWELKDFFKKHWKVGAFIFIITLLMLMATNIKNFPDSLSNLILTPFIFTLIYLGFSMFFQGTNIIVKTYQKKTFLLESMIAYSPSKILLAKYIIAIILNVMYGLILLIILWLFLLSDNINIIREITKIIGQIGFFELFKYFLSVVVYSMMFTSLVVLVFIITKCINPNKKGTVIISIVIWWLIIYFQNLLFDTIIGNLERDNVIFFLSLIINIMFIIIYYFISVKLTKDKLEIYT